MDPLKKLKLQDELDNPTKLRTAAAEMVYAWHERKRIFDELAQPNLFNDRIAELQRSYIDASKEFDAKRNNFLRLEGK